MGQPGGLKMVDGASAHAAVPPLIAKVMTIAVAVVALWRVVIGWAGMVGVTMLFYGYVGVLSRAISSNFIQQRCHSCARVDVTKKT